MMRLLDENDPNPVIAHRLGSRAPFLIICDHAGRAVPHCLGALGLTPAAFERHIAWDIGAADLSLALGAAFGAGVIMQAYSRMVIDCNRTPGRADSMPVLSDGTTIPGNAELSAAEIAARVDEVHAPYHDAIARELEDRRAKGLRTTILFIHSFTPTLAGQARPWTLGVLHRGDSAMSHSVLEELRQAPDQVIGDNEPYRMDETDYSAGRHTLAADCDYLELEVRQDLIADADSVGRMAALLVPILLKADAMASRGRMA